MCILKCFLLAQLAEELLSFPSTGDCHLFQTFALEMGSDFLRVCLHGRSWPVIGTWGCQSSSRPSLEGPGTSCFDAGGETFCQALRDLLLSTCSVVSRLLLCAAGEELAGSKTCISSVGILIDGTAASASSADALTTWSFFTLLSAAEGSYRRSLCPLGRACTVACLYSSTGH